MNFVISVAIFVINLPLKGIVNYCLAQLNNNREENESFNKINSKYPFDEKLSETSTKPSEKTSHNSKK